METEVKIVFVILHYLTYDDTKDCVESIRKWIDKGIAYKIIIVDNASPNDSYDKLQRDYENCLDIDLIKNDRNLGFANGNNVGFRFAKYTYDPNYIVLLNNDTMLIEKDFYKKIDEEYIKSRFALLGPMIYSLNGKCDSNPFRTKTFSHEEISILNNYYKGLISANRFHVEKYYNKWNKLDESILHYTSDFITRQENVVLHGSFMVFSKEFTRQHDGLNPKTFMYAEEDILYAELRKEGLKTVYEPTIHIFHREASATKTTNNAREKRIFFCKNMLVSLDVLLEVIDCSIEEIRGDYSRG